MDVPVSAIPSSEGSFDDASASTRPTTPSSSPLFEKTPTLDELLAQCSLSRKTAITRICVIGAGYVGGPTAAVLALHNPHITVDVVDRDPRRIQKWQSPHLPVHEPGLDRVVRVARDGALVTLDADADVDVDVDAVSEGPQRTPNLHFTCDAAGSIARADMVFLAVNTPTKTFGVGAGRATDMTAVDEAVREIGQHAQAGAIIVEKSTVPCGTAQRIRQTLATLRPNTPFEVLSNPEFLSEGSAIANLTAPDRVLIGSADTPAGRQAAQRLADLYAAWVPRGRIVAVNAWSSELGKLVANAMLAQRISSINAVSAICEQTGAAVDEVARAVGMDARLGPQFLRAGVGFGGSCFRKDIASLTYLAESLGLPDVAAYWDQVLAMNDAQRRRFARRVVDRFDGNLRGRKLAVLGFAFKKDTGDTRESPAAEVIRALLEERPAEIAVFDPYCAEEDVYRELQGAPRVRVLADPYLACSRAHAVLVLTDCEQFRNAPVGGGGGAGRRESDGDSLFAASRAEVWTSASNGMGYRLAPQEACPEDCSTCRTTASRPTATEPLEWARVAYNLQEPKCVFDGRGFLDAAEMERLGVQLVTVGRRSVEGR
ncbi:udp-glucose 6-dehydrogenase [Aspergillus ambiguus]|uniref:UDP-glucose dehydrogenase n=1 Tax=Aspergillus ambiguus TaxID=176160 RepID=UPI003CCD44A0